MLSRLYRRLFPRTAREADAERARRLGEANRAMQHAAEQQRRQDATARYLASINPRR